MVLEPTRDDAVFLSTLPAERGERRLALAVALVSAAVFVAVAPFAKLQLAPVWGFLPTYQSALFVTDLITAVLLFGQFRISRFRPVLVLACGYLFTAFIAAATAAVATARLSAVPGAMSPAGLLWSGPHSTSWLYMFWHAGFPLFVIAYAVMKDRDASNAQAPQAHANGLIAASVALVAGAAVAFTLLATAGHAALPPILQGNRYTTGAIALTASMWGLSVLALLALWRRRPHSVLDLWLMVVMCAWVFDIGLSAVLNSGRFDLGFYAGRIYGLLAASFVLVVLLLENGTLYARLVRAHERLNREVADAKRLSDELAGANELLAEKNHQLVEASRLKSEFLSNMSHELRTPLNAVIGFSEVMKDGLAGELSAQQSGYIGHIFQSGQHLLSLINDILDLSKIEAGKVEVDFEPVDLDALLADSVVFLGDRAKSTQIRLVRDSRGGGPGTMLADRRRVKQIVYNLLSNALKFTPAKGQVTLHDQVVDRARALTALPGFGGGVRMPLPEGEFAQFVEISVSDTGIGLSTSDAAKLFTPFTQVTNPLTRHLEGTGLGLAMVRRLAELQGGTVAVTSELGRGSCFTVWLPWREAPVPRQVEAPQQPEADRSAWPLALVVEDDDEAAMLIRLQLEHEGFRVHRAASAEAALQCADRIMPAVITVDIILPGMDGWEFIGRLKEVPRWELVPVVVVSVVADQNRGFSLGASLVLQKPLNRETLVKGLSRLGLRPNAEHEVTVLVIDDDANAVEILATNLRQCGYTVLRALGGREGIDLARRFRPDLIALDLEMPDVNGFDVVAALTATPATADIPVIVVTARQLSPKLRTKLTGHVHDIVDKAEFNHGHFIGEVRRALKRAAKGAQAASVHPS